MPDYCGPRQLRVDAQPRRLAQHRAYHQPRAYRLCRERRRKFFLPGWNSGRRRADPALFASPTPTERNDRAELTCSKTESIAALRNSMERASSASPAVTASLRDRFFCHPERSEGPHPRRIDHPRQLGYPNDIGEALVVCATRDDPREGSRNFKTQCRRAGP
jgi:hypothetical protein